MDSLHLSFKSKCDIDGQVEEAGGQGGAVSTATTPIVRDRRVGIGTPFLAASDLQMKRIHFFQAH